MKAETFLPVFNGFYNTIWEANTENYEYESGLGWDDYDFDNEAFELETVENICDWVESNCPFIRSVKLQTICSPKEYNFRNDSANVVIDIKVRDFAKWLKSNAKELDMYLKQKYTSCSGFISSYSNTYDDWHNETKGFQKLDIDGHRLGSLLDFYFSIEFNDPEEDAYYSDCSPYVESFITPKATGIKELEISDLQLVAANVLKSDFQPFGYLDLLVKEYKQKYPDYWIEKLASDEYKLILSEAKIDKVDLDLELMD